MHRALRLSATGLLTCLLAVGGLFALQAPANAFFTLCAGWSETPEARSGTSSIYYGAMMKCGGTGTSLYRVKAYLYSEWVNPGPIPNDWEETDETTWSANVVQPTMAAKNKIISCGLAPSQGGWKTYGEGQLRSAIAGGFGDEDEDGICGR